MLGEACGLRAELLLRLAVVEAPGSTGNAAALTSAPSNGTTGRSGWELWMALGVLRHRDGTAAFKGDVPRISEVVYGRESPEIMAVISARSLRAS